MDGLAFSVDSSERGGIRYDNKLPFRSKQKNVSEIEVMYIYIWTWRQAYKHNGTMGPVAAGQLCEQQLHSRPFFSSPTLYLYIYLAHLLNKIPISDNGKCLIT